MSKKFTVNTDESRWRDHKVIIPREEIFKLRKNEEIEDWQLSYDNSRGVFELTLSTMEQY